MIVTEEEAKTKRCQESFAAQAVVTPDGSPLVMATSSWGSAKYVTTAPANCIGSACMAWRWKWNVTLPLVGVVVHSHILASDGGKLGYCGKAGEP